jgi:transcriptional regulator with XRE-family HTH domain
VAPVYVRSLIEQLKFLGWEQKDIAKRLGVSEAYVSQWATGKRPVSKRHERPLLRLVEEALAHDRAAMEAELAGLGVGADDAPREEQERRLAVVRAWEQRRAQLKAYMEAWENELYVGAGKCSDEIRYRLDVLKSPYAKLDPMKLSPEDRHRLRQACRMLVLHFDYLDQFDRVPPRQPGPQSPPVDFSTPEKHLHILRTWFGVGLEEEE